MSRAQNFHEFSPVPHYATAALHHQELLIRSRKLRRLAKREDPSQNLRDLAQRALNAAESIDELLRRRPDGEGESVCYSWFANDSQPQLSAARYLVDRLDESPEPLDATDIYLGVDVASMLQLGLRAEKKAIGSFRLSDGRALLVGPAGRWVTSRAANAKPLPGDLCEVEMTRGEAEYLDLMEPMQGKRIFTYATKPTELADAYRLVAPQDRRPLLDAAAAVIEHMRACATVCQLSALRRAIAARSDRYARDLATVKQAEQDMRSL